MGRRSKGFLIAGAALAGLGVYCDGALGTGLMIGGIGMAALFVGEWAFQELRPYDPWKKHRKRALGERK